MTIKQKIKEFETILIQELNNENNRLSVQYKLSILLEVYRDQFRTELKDNSSFYNDEKIHKMD